MDATRAIAITGATGFVGRHVVERLLEEPRTILRCLVRPSSDSRRRLPTEAQIQWVEGDVCEPDTLGPLVSGASSVVHLAGYRDFWSRRRSLYYELNTSGAENVFRAALDARVERVVQVSTPLAFGVPDRIPFDEDTPPGPHPSDYARSKHMADEIGWRMHAERDLPLTVVHLAARQAVEEARSL